MALKGTYSFSGLAIENALVVMGSVDTGTGIARMRVFQSTEDYQAGAVSLKTLPIYVEGLDVTKSILDQVQAAAIGEAGLFTGFSVVDTPAIDTAALADANDINTPPKLATTYEAVTSTN